MIAEFKHDIGMQYITKFVRADPIDPKSALEAACYLYEKGYEFEAVLVYVLIQQYLYQSLRNILIYSVFLMKLQLIQL